MKKNKVKRFKSLKSLLFTKTSLALFVLFILAVFFRSYNLSNSLFFGPEQGIDFERIKSIAVEHRPVLVGAKTDIAGIFHGPIYYYVSTIPFLLSHGDPVAIAIFLIVINSLTVFPLYFLGKEMFGKRTGFIAACLFAVSFQAVSYTHWLSSHPLVIPLSALFLLGMYAFLQGRKKFLFLVSFSYPLLGQAEFLNYLLYGVVIVFFIILFLKTFRKQSLLFYLFNILIIAILGFFHYAIFEWRNQFIMTKSILSLSHGGGFYISYAQAVGQVYEVGLKTLSLTILPFAPELLILFIFAASLLFLFKSKFQVAKKILAVQFFVPILLLVILRHGILDQFFVYALVPEILIIAFFVDVLIRKNKFAGVFLLLVILFTQVQAWHGNASENKNMFFASVQPDLHIKDERAVINEIYTRQNGKDFSFQAYTIPYWSQQGWEYLFWQYGKAKYGYLPVTQNGRTLYVIVQDDPSSKHFQNDWLKYTVSHWGTLKGTFKKGIFTVQILDVPWVKN